MASSYSPLRTLGSTRSTTSSPGRVNVDPPMVERTHQRAAIILLFNEDSNPSTGQLEKLSDDANWFSIQRNDDTRLHNYFRATGGRATLGLGGLSTYLKSVPGTPHGPTGLLWYAAAAERNHAGWHLPHAGTDHRTPREIAGTATSRTRSSA